MSKQLELPKFTARMSSDFPDFLVVTCPREDCIGRQRDRPFLVHRRTWLKPIKIKVERSGALYTVVGRPCPYCSRVARIPTGRIPG